MAAQQIVVEGGHVGYTFPLMLPLIATTVALVLSYYWLQNRRIAKMGNLMPGKHNPLIRKKNYFKIVYLIAGPPTLPLLGNAHYVIGKNHNGELSRSHSKTRCYYCRSSPMFFS